KRDINLVVAYTKKKGKWKHKLYFSTDLELSAERLLEYYQTRFQIEFTFRDAKQHTGLNHCQARSENKLHFHFNTSLTAINIAKITHWMSIEKDKRPPFSMANIKTLYNNQLLLERVFSMFAIKPNMKKNKEKIQKLLLYGTHAA
ncbi:MAG: transposase, partial [Flavobacteriales bacterium]